MAGIAAGLMPSILHAEVANGTRLPAGVYEGVKVSRETGDEDGLRLELRYIAGAPKVRFWWCAGECLPRPVHNVSISANQITFVADDEAVLPGGKLEVHPHTFTGVFKAGRLSFGSVGFWKPQPLKLYPGKTVD